MRDMTETINDFKVAIRIDIELSEKTRHFKNKNLAVQSMLESMNYAKMDEVLEVCIAIPEIKDKLIPHYQKVQEERKRSEEANARAWADVDMSNRANW